MYSRRSIPLALVLLASLVASLAACTGSDDDDDVATTATPPFTDCEIHWYGDSSATPGYLNWYLVSMGPSDLSTGSHGYGVSTGTPKGYFLYNFPADATTVPINAVASNGSFSLTAASLEPGESILFNDTTSQTYLGVTSAGQLGSAVGNGGTGTFDGPMNDRDLFEGSAPAEFGTGTLTIMFNGSSLTVGARGTLVGCYDADELFTEPAGRRTLPSSISRALSRE